MRGKLFGLATLATIMLVVSTSGSADVKRVPYPRVQVELAPAYAPDAAFDSFRKAFIDAVSRKDAAALFALVAPGFVSTVNSVLASEFDPGRDSQHNFRVLFGFRAPGKDADGEVESGPFWDALAVLANDGTYSVSSENLVCSPVAASVADDTVLEEARAKIETPDEAAEWHFVVRSTPVTRVPDDRSAPIAMIGMEAVPVLKAFPPAEAGAAAPVPTHYEVLLPSGRTGWISANAARAFQTDRLCYALTANGEWKIAIYDSAQ
jgi:hypothetical protein